MNRKVWFYIRDILLYAGLLILVAAVICWLLNWRTSENFSTGFFFSGVAALIFGTARVMRFGMVRSGTYQYGQSVGADRIMDANRKESGEIYGDTPFLLKMVVSALICFFLSWLVGIAI
jgi:4-amino-4-deoxy-L-arabinose transferase-like glycosyltransferase